MQKDVTYYISIDKPRVHRNSVRCAEDYEKKRRRMYVYVCVEQKERYIESVKKRREKRGIIGRRISPRTSSRKGGEEG
jgi:hypothetical protein